MPQDFLLTIARGTPPARAAAEERAPWRDGDGAVCARLYRFHDVWTIDWPGLAVFAIDRGRTITAWPDPHVSPARVTDFFLRRLQPLLFQLNGLQSLHASGVLAPAGAIAFCGQSGSGKSTLAYALHLAGLPQFADDAVVIDTSGSIPTVRPLPFAPQLRGEAAPVLRGSAREVLTAPSALAEASALVLIVVLQPDPESPAMPAAEAVSGPAACLTLLTHAHTFDADLSHDALLGSYAALANTVPVMRVRYRPNLAELPLLVQLVRGLATLKPEPAR